MGAVKGWPICTVVAGCYHEKGFDTEEEVTEFVKEHMGEFVNRNGYAACECHADLAPKYDVLPFPCDASEAAS